MGFDLYGTNPIEQKHNKPDFELYEQDQEAWHKQYKYWSEQDGSYFRNNVWWWRRLATYVLDCCDDMISEHDHQAWHENGGHEVSKALAIMIADRMQEHIDSGDAKQFEDRIKQKVKKAAEHNKFIQKQLDDLCDKHNVDNCSELKPKAREEWGKIYDNKSWDDSYPFEVRNLESFIKFCRESGGFEIC